MDTDRVVIGKRGTLRRKLSAAGIAATLAIAAFGVYAAGNLIVTSKSMSGEGVATSCSSGASAQPINPYFMNGAWVYQTVEIDINGTECSGYKFYAMPLDKNGATMAGGGEATISDSQAIVALTAPISADELGSWAMVAAGSPNTPPAAPDAPTALVATATGPQTMELTWVNSSDNGSPITGYTFTRSRNDGAGYGSWTSVAHGTCTTLSTSPVTTRCSVTGTITGSSYKFKMQTYNAIGASPDSAESAPIVGP